jgi:hypothetical protein
VARAARWHSPVRQEKSKPLVLALKAWFEQQLTRVSGKATIAEDIRYALNQHSTICSPCERSRSSYIQLLRGLGNKL